jgi:hypothetical protein
MWLKSTALEWIERAVQVKAMPFRRQYGTYKALSP